MYKIEGQAESLRGIITCGSRIGYHSNKEFDLAQINEVVEKAHKQIEVTGFRPIPCIISIGELNTKTLRADVYRERVYLLDFLWSPIGVKMDKKEFYNLLVQYAGLIGEAMQQERIYLDFDGKTIVFKRSK